MEIKVCLVTLSTNTRKLGGDVDVDVVFKGWRRLDLVVNGRLEVEREVDHIEDIIFERLVDRE